MRHSRYFNDYQNLWPGHNLKDGKIIADGDQNKVINSENLNKLFGIQVEVTNNNGLWNINRLSK